MKVSAGDRADRIVTAAAALGTKRPRRPQLSDEVADGLRSAIMSRKLQPGTFIRLHETAAQLDVSITPVREALLKLASEGLVRREPHRGYVVLPLTTQDLRDICWLQDTIAGELAATTADRFTDGQIDELERINNRLIAAVAAGDADAIVSAESSFHEVLGTVTERVMLALFLLHAQRYLGAQVHVPDPERGRAVVSSNRRLVAMLRRGRARPATHDASPPRAEPDAAGPRAETIGVGQLRSDTLSYFERVETGESIAVVRRGKLAARIVPDTQGAQTARDLSRSDEPTRRTVVTRVALDQLRTFAGRYLDRVIAGEMLEVVHGGQVMGLVVAPDGE